MRSDKLKEAIEFLNGRQVHVNTRNEQGTAQPLDAETIIAIAELVRAYDRTLVGPSGGPYVSATPPQRTYLSLMGGELWSESEGDSGNGR